MPRRREHSLGRCLASASESLSFYRLAIQSAVEPPDAASKASDADPRDACCAGWCHATIGVTEGFC